MKTEVLNLLPRLLPGHSQLMGVASELPCTESELPCTESMSFLLANTSAYRAA